MHRQQFTFQNKLLFKFKPNNGLFFFSCFYIFKKLCCFYQNRSLHVQTSAARNKSQTRQRDKLLWCGGGGGGAETRHVYLITVLGQDRAFTAGGRSCQRGRTFLENEMK